MKEGEGGGEGGREREGGRRESEEVKEGKGGGEGGRGRRERKEREEGREECVIPLASPSIM